MKAAIVALVTCIALVTSGLAQPRKVLVLPLDGNAPAAQRAKLNASVGKLAKAKLDGDVTIGDTTFDETAAAVGCDPKQPACAETVRTTLQVDELVYGSAKTSDGTTTVMVTRVSATGEPTSQITVISESDDGAAAEPALEPAFASASEPSGSAAVGPGSAGESPSTAEKSSFFATRERKLGVAFGAGGVIGLVIGVAFWSSASGMQDDIDAHPDMTRPQIDDLKALEDEAAGKATWGNVFVVLGLAATGVGGYFLWKDRKNRRSAATVVPAPVEGGGMTFVLGGRW